MRMRTLRLTLWALPVGVLAGLSAALFLWLLDLATTTRIDNGWLVWLLPVGGLMVGGINRWAGPVVGAGTSMVLAQAQRSTSALPGRLAPTVLVTTLLTHVVGGSAGREGTGVQMAAGLTDSVIAGPRDMDPRQRSDLLRVAVAAGFGAVFGVPFAGAVFGLEAARGGRLRLLVIPALVASFIGDRVVLLLGIPHLSLPDVVWPGFDLSMLLLLGLAGAVFGLMAVGFIWLSRITGGVFAALVPSVVLRPVAGSLVLLASVAALGSRDHLGLSVELIIDATTLGVGVAATAFVVKAVATAVTLGSGFRGGEVTPLFVVGATLGATFADLAGVSVPLFAALGLVTVFAAGARVPLTGVVMGIELFGWSLAAPLLLVGVIARLIVGRRSIYGAATPRNPG